jgi:TPR repeat protein
MLSEGRGVEADPTAGRAWLERAAAAGLADAQASLAEMMVNGRGGPRDHPGALALFRAAAEAGHAGGAFAAGVMLSGGHEVPADRKTAQACFQWAAERGHPYAQLMLGRYLARDLAGMRDPAQARHWPEQARARGIAEAAAELAALPPLPEAAELATAARR